MRFAYLGRTSDEDAQDPSLSIPRQLFSCEAVVKPLGDTIVAHYWDIESGRKFLDVRGNGADASRFNIAVPRDGGINDLIRDATTGRFDAVIVESIDRVSRMTADSTRVEQELERAGVTLFAADEPLNTNATSILTRRVKQGIAEWYVRDLMEKSRRGMEESVRQGWHTGGRPPYGYMLEEHPHPNPSKAREGKHKHRLIIDPLRGPVIVMIFDDYCVRLLGLGEICEKLNRNIEKFPAPIPNRKDATDLSHTWSRSVIGAILRNPKYTGFNVWGRNDKRRGRQQIRPRDEWVWSANRTHEPLVSRELFEMVEQRAERKARAVKVGMPRQGHKQVKRQAQRLYPLRGRVRCALCGHSMEGSHQRGSNWYRCQYVRRRSDAAASHADHPKVLGIKEERLLEPILDFLSRRIFSADRLRLLRDELAASTASTWEEHAVEASRLEAELSKVNRSLRAQTLRLEEHDDPAHPVVALASERIVELSTQKAAIADALDALAAKRPAGHHPDEIVAMLDAVPDLRPTIERATDEELAEIFKAFDVRITYNKNRQALDFAATITSELVPNEDDRPEGRSRVSDIAGAGFEPATFGL